jgi:hypothetical protein
VLTPLKAFLSEPVAAAAFLLGTDGVGEGGVAVFGRDVDRSFAGRKK